MIHSSYQHSGPSTTWPQITIARIISSTTPQEFLPLGTYDPKDWGT